MARRPRVKPHHEALLDAACIGQDPAWFDVTSYRWATYALSICRECPITYLCLAVVRPEQSWFDGVAGGKVWRNGRQVEHERGI